MRKSSGGGERVADLKPLFLMVNTDHLSSNFATHANYLEQNWPLRIQQRDKKREGHFLQFHRNRLWKIKDLMNNYKGLMKACPGRVSSVMVNRSCD